jgi:hypothetical protein
MGQRVRHDLSVPADDMVTPSLHQCPTLLKQVSAPVRRLGLVLDRVREGHLRHLVGKAGLLGGPVAESRPKPMGGHLNLHAPERLQEHHV